MNAELQAPKAPEELWQSETHELVVRMFRVRALVIPLLLAVLLAFVFYDPIPWKLAWVGITMVVVVALFWFEQRRISRALANAFTVHFNLLLAVVVQTSIIYVTGGIESPLLVVYVPFGLLAGLSLAERWRAVSVVAVPAASVLVFATGAVSGWLPRTVPAFLHLGEGFAREPSYVYTKATVLLLLLVMTVFLGSGVRAMFERVVFSAVRAQQGALESLESRNREVLSTAVTIAHELKNPMSSIQGLAQLLLRRAEPGTKDRERLEVMLREIGRMTTVLDGFRSFSRPMSSLSIVSTSLSELASQVVALHEGSAARRGVKLVASVEPDIDVECDVQKVKQALVNVLQNAIEASPRGAEVEVRVAKGKSGETNLAVLDQGPGIAAEVRERLFTPGFTTKERGTGIGLVVARSVIEQHGGTLALEARPEGGSAALLTLPRKPKTSGDAEP